MALHRHNVPRADTQGKECDGSALRFEPDLVIDRRSQPLLTPGVLLRRFPRKVAEKKLDLLKLSAGRVV